MKVKNYNYNYFDHDADIGIIGQGKTLTAAFESAAYAMFAIMADTKNLSPEHTIEFSFDESDNEMALVRWLNLLISYSVAKQLLFNQFHLQQENQHWRAQASGVSWQNNNIVRGTEVKGATLTELSVKKIKGGWESRCVVDV